VGRIDIVKNFFKTEWAKLREMSFAEKRWYIWTYYKIGIFVAALLIFAVGYFINIRFINPRQSEYLYVIWLGEPVALNTLPELEEQLSVIVNDPVREAVFISNFLQTGNPQMDMALQTRFIALLQIGALDIFLTTREGLDEVAEAGWIRPICELMEAVADIAPELYTMLRDERIITAYIAENEHASEVAISLTGSPLVDAFGFDELYLSVVVNTTRIDSVAKALEVFWNE